MKQPLVKLFVAAAAWAMGIAANAADPLYVARPYDEITLDQNNAGVKLKVQPLNLPGRALPAAADRKEDLEIELIDRPGEQFRVGWNNIAGIRFFEELVLAEAQQHVKAERFDEAYPYFQFLETKYPKTAGLKETIEEYLWSQIASDFKAQRNDAALALLLELHQRNPQRQGLSAAFEQVTLKLVDERLAAENYRAARGLLKSLTQRFPDRAAAASGYETQMRDKAADAIAAARAALAGGKYREAHRAVRQALGIWPAIENGRELVKEIHEKYPVVAIGVTQPLSASGAARDDWAARRTRPLLAPAAFQRLGSAMADDRPYRSPLGEVVADKDPRRAIFRLKSGAAPISAHDLARGLLAAADRQQPGFDPAWAEMLSRVSVRSQDELLIELSRPPIRIEAWLAAALDHPGAYRMDSSGPPETIFVRHAAAASSGTTPASELVERAYADSAAALGALRRGEVSVVDRISPWEVKSLAESKEIAVGRYALPAVHVLAPNPSRPLAVNRTLKRAILYAIDRETILHRSLLDNQAMAGCQTVSGPFPRPQSQTDPRGFAYDDEIVVRPYDPGLAMALVAAQQPLAADNAAATTKSPPLVLAYPAGDVPRVACQSIARQLQAVGIPVTLRELAAGQPPGDDHDLLYAELPMEEPLVDVWRLFGPLAEAGGTNRALLASLRELGQTADLLNASRKLKDIHALAAAELPVIPLWQLVDHFAYHTSVKGIGPQPVTLYENIDQWHLELRLPPE